MASLSDYICTASLFNNPCDTVMLNIPVASSQASHAHFTHTADPRLRVHVLAERVFLLSRASSDAYEPYMFLKDHSEKSLSPGVAMVNPSS